MVAQELERELLALCQDLGIFIPGHFEVSSGLHSDLYIDKELIFGNPELFDRFCGYQADFLLDPGGRDTSIDVVVGPETGGSRIAENVARLLSQKTQRQVVAVAARKDGQGGFFLEAEDLERVRCRNIAVTEDVLTTGRSAAMTMNLCRDKGANVATLQAWFRRGQRTQSVAGVRANVLCHREFPLHEAPCAQCLRRIPLSQKPTARQLSPSPGQLILAY